MDGNSLSGVPNRTVQRTPEEVLAQIAEDIAHVRRTLPGAVQTLNDLYARSGREGGSDVAQLQSTVVGMYETVKRVEKSPGLTVPPEEYARQIRDASEDHARMLREASEDCARTIREAGKEAGEATVRRHARLLNEAADHVAAAMSLKVGKTPRKELAWAFVVGVAGAMSLAAALTVALYSAGWWPFSHTLIVPVTSEGQWNMAIDMLAGVDPVKTQRMTWFNTVVGDVTPNAGSLDACRRQAIEEQMYVRCAIWIRPIDPPGFLPPTEHLEHTSAVLEGRHPWQAE